jgi:hypothetical protein
VCPCVCVCVERERAIIMLGRILFPMSRDRNFGSFSSWHTYETLLIQS